MTAYSDVPEISSLYKQREVITNAITMLDTGGALTSISISPGPDSGGMGMMSAQVALQPPTPPDTVAAIRSVLVDMQADIDSQLADLGVTDQPALAS
jgi:hypothetical protein